MQRHHNTFDPSNLTCTLNFLSTFETTCDSTEVREGFTMRLIHFFHNPARSIVSFRTLLLYSSSRSLEGALFSYFDVRNHLVAMYANEDVIPKTVDDILSCTQPYSATYVSYAQPFWETSLSCSSVNGEVTSKGIFIVGLPE